MYNYLVHMRSKGLSDQSWCLLFFLYSKFSSSRVKAPTRLLPEFHYTVSTFILAFWPSKYSYGHQNHTHQRLPMWGKYMYYMNTHLL